MRRTKSACSPVEDQKLRRALNWIAGAVRISRKSGQRSRSAPDGTMKCEEIEWLLALGQSESGRAASPETVPGRAEAEALVPPTPASATEAPAAMASVPTASRPSLVGYV